MKTVSERSQIALDRDGSVAIVTMNRAEKRNALSLAMMRELDAAFEELGAQRDVRAVILRGDGPAFCAGHDLRELVGRDADAYRTIFDACVDLMARIAAIPQPVIAEVARVATAAGCQLVAACDLAVASTEATFATPGVRIGLFCSTPMVALTRAIGRKRSHGDAAHRRADRRGDGAGMGPGQSRRRARGAARRKPWRWRATIASASRGIVGLGKAAFYEQIDLDTASAYDYTKGVMTTNAQEDDAREGIAAFLERRPPKWHE